MHDSMQRLPTRLCATPSRRALSIAACLLALAACNARGEGSAPVAAAKAPAPAVSTSIEGADASERPAARDAAPTTAETLVVVGPGGAVARGALGSSYRLGSDRGRPNHGSTLFSKRVMAQIRSPVRVRTNRPVPWRMPAEARR